MTKTPSPKQIDANRRNAQKSTGPKTPAGRAVSKMNALKHGILSRQVVVRGKCIQESEREFAALHQEFWEHSNPVGPVEEMLVETIVTARWRLRRARTAESGEIALSVDGGHWKRGSSHPLWFAWRLEKEGEPLHPMKKAALENIHMEADLMEVRASVEKDGELTEAIIRAVKFNGQPYQLTVDLVELRSQLQKEAEELEQSQKKPQASEPSPEKPEASEQSQENREWPKHWYENRQGSEQSQEKPQASEPSPENAEGLEAAALRAKQKALRAEKVLRAKQKAQALAGIDNLLRRIHWDTSIWLELEEEEEGARRAAAALPRPEVLNKILRYEAALERQMYHAMNHLERLQRIRKGDAVPPPLAIEVSERP